MITFKEQFDKLTTAYINNEVKPYIGCACFVGNLLNRVGTWGCIREYRSFGESILQDWCAEVFGAGDKFILEESEGTYSAKEILSLENLFLKTLERKTIGYKAPTFSNSLDTMVTKHPNYEEALFTAFSVTLDALRGIHESKGEKVDEFIFTKRKLKAV